MTPDELRAVIDDPDRRAEVAAVELTEAFLTRIDEIQPVINAFITTTPELALEDARRADARRAAGEKQPLAGMPVAVKDNIDVGGVRTTVASKFFENYVPPDDSEVVRRLREAGAVIVGKTMLHEFVYGATCVNKFYGICRNPWDLDRIPGGSSGGSAAALAADLCLGALGSDTGGSVRIPAHLNGVTGLRPTFGSVSSRGAFPICWTFDTVGPMARSVVDVAHMYAVMAGFDLEDPRSEDHPIADVLTGLESGVGGVRIGVPAEFFFDDLEPGIEDCVRAAAQQFVKLGAEVVEVSLPGSARANEICTLMIRTDALALHHDRYENQRELFGEDISRRLALGYQIAGWQFAQMAQQMYEWRRDMRRLFRDQIDLVLTPTAVATAPQIEGAEMIATTATLTRFTYPWSLAHMPAISLPCGFAQNGMPVGVQLGADQWKDALLLRAGAAYQSATSWHRCRPPVRVPVSQS
jgi:aspartyl-tRNA(Asn)/glutamyl-tRNA(Gln) amidotransferase subunit A